MTDQELLDMFACAAMQGLLMGDNDKSERSVAQLAYMIAEAMVAQRGYIAERKKRYATNKV